jgi:hypothetical protein
MDTAPRTRENRAVLAPGVSRRRIARTLQTAYADGLLSDDTFVARLDRVLEDRLIDPLRLVGDLSQRAPTGGFSARLMAAIDSLSGRFGAARQRAGAHTTLLALDWNGEPDELFVGRHPSCDLVISQLSVSRRHARLMFRDGRWIVHDLASTNGTTVNGLKVGRCELRPGDRLALGNHQLLVD